jgi:hypothetical protein
MIAAEANGDPATEELIAIVDGECRGRFESRPSDDPDRMNGDFPPSVLAIGSDTDQGFRAAVMNLPADMHPIEQLHLFDLDLNGRNELVLVYGRPLFAPIDVPGAGLDALPGRGVAIFWNIRYDRSAVPAIAYDEDTPTIITLEDPNHAPFALAALNADGDRAPELAILGAGAEGATAYLWIASIDDHRDRALGAPLFDLQITPSGTLQLAAEDLDRDGLSDLVFGDGARVHLYRSKPEGVVVE